MFVESTQPIEITRFRLTPRFALAYTALTAWRPGDRPIRDNIEWYELPLPYRSVSVLGDRGRLGDAAAALDLRRCFTEC